MPFWKRKPQEESSAASVPPLEKGEQGGFTRVKIPLSLSRIKCGTGSFRKGEDTLKGRSRRRSESEAETWLVVGLGNPGEKYKRSHHNIGFMCLDHFAREHNITLERSRLHAKIGDGKISGKHVIVAKPQTFMNLSGEAVGRLVRRYHVPPANLVVVHDEMDLPLGKVRIRLGGSSAGHNGIKSIVENIGTEEFVRIRVGVGHPEGEGGKAERHEVIGFVLGDFTREEQAVVERVIRAVSQAIDLILSEGVTAAMNKVNGLDLAKEKGKG